MDFRRRTCVGDVMLRAWVMLSLGFTALAASAEPVGERLPSTLRVSNEAVPSHRKVQPVAARMMQDPAPSPSDASRLPSPDVDKPKDEKRDADKTAEKKPEELPQPPGIELAELQEIAMRTNPTLVQAVAAVQQAQGNWLQVGLYPNPAAAYMATQTGDKGTAGQQGWWLEQQIVRGRKLQLNRQVASRDIAMAQRDLESQRMRVFNDVRTEYYNVLVSQRQLEISEELVKIGEAALKAADQLFNAKEVSRVDVLQARIEVNAARINLVNARNRYDAAWRRLSSVMGVPDMAPMRVIGDLLADLPPFSWEESINRLMIESPQLASTRIGVDRAVWALRRARVERIQNFTAGGGTQHDNGGVQDIGNVQITMPIPVWNRNQGGVRAAEAQVRSARAEVGRLELQLTQQLATQFEFYANTRNQVQRYRSEILPDAREALNLVTAGYKQGELSFLVLLTAQRTFFYTNLAYLDAQRQLWQSSVAIEGLLLTDSLQSGGNNVPSINYGPPGTITIGR